jgi:hypothetical protein
MSPQRPGLGFGIIGWRALFRGDSDLGGADQIPVRANALGLFDAENEGAREQPQRGAADRGDPVPLEPALR